MIRIRLHHLLKIHLILAAGILASCGSDTSPGQRAAYYWRSEFAPDSRTREHLDKNGIRVLYVRFFDVAWSAASAQPVPVGQVRFSQYPENECSVVPVVYITVDALRRLDSAAVPDLAHKLLAQVDSIADRASIYYSEFQLDCDWTPSTREKFFSIASIIQTRLHSRKQLLSATIRLHQVKYPDRTGVPPVDRGMLMFYNMGRISATHPENSIFDEEISGRYTDYIDSYPLALDIALPIFHWTLHFRGGRPVGIINKTSAADLAAYPALIQEAHGRFLAIHAVWLQGESILPGDVLKVEEVSPELCLRAARQAAAELPPSTRRVALFEADSVYLSHYEIADIEKIFRVFE